MKKSITLEWTQGVDVEWHLEGGKIVIDRDNIGLDAETFNMIWPGWMLDAAKGKK